MKKWFKGFGWWDILFILFTLTYEVLYFTIFIHHLNESVYLAVTLTILALGLLSGCIAWFVGGNKGK